MSTRKISYHGPAVIHAALECLLDCLSAGEGVIFLLGSGPVVLLGMLLAQLASVTEDISRLL